MLKTYFLPLVLALALVALACLGAGAIAALTMPAFLGAVVVGFPVAVFVASCVAFVRLEK